MHFSTHVIDQDLPIFFDSSDLPLFDPLINDIFLDEGEEDFWMSSQPTNNNNQQQKHDPINNNYMQATRAHVYPQQHLSSQPDFYSAGFAGEWQPHSYSDGIAPFGLNNQLARDKFRQHQRALSNSTATSQASTASPNQPAPLYSSNHLLDPSQTRSFQTQTHYYPTPSHTPTQDHLMERSLNRRTAAGNTSAPAQAQQNKFPTNQTHQQQQQQQQAMRAISSSQQYPAYTVQDYPSTPGTANGDYSDRRYFGPSHPIPRLEHSMTQACADELYNPAVTIPPSQYPQNANPSLLQPGPVQQRIQQAREARSKSPADNVKRETSPYVPGSTENPSGFAPLGPIKTAASQRLTQKLEDDAYQQWRHANRGATAIQQEPKTISPKDAYVDDFRDPTEDPLGSGSLFPESSRSSQLFEESYRSGYGVSAGSRFPTSNFPFQQPSLPTSASMTSSTGDFKFTPLQRNASSSDDTPGHPISMETSRSEPDSSQDSLPPPRAQHRSIAGTTSASETGTYSCTYAGCPQRFATPALLQKHKREAHRPAAGIPIVSRPTTQSPRPEDSESASPGTPLNRNSQAGPHRCDRINPSTGKSCNTVFSRPYDLTRHEDTIHARRPKVSCKYCLERGEEKTFSRADALTRHLRVVHPDVEVFGKSGRRRGF